MNQFRKFLKVVILLAAAIAAVTSYISHQNRTSTATPRAEFASIPFKTPDAATPAIKTVDWAPANLERHWNKHRAEFPEFKSAREYGDFALKFFRDPPPGTLRKTRSRNGDKLYYHPESNIFGVTTSKNVPKTLFKPDRGIRYWKRQ